MTQVLEMIFGLADGKSLTLSVASPKLNVTETEIDQAMQTIITSGAFVRDGQAIVAKKTARIVERNVTEFVVN